MGKFVISKNAKGEFQFNLRADNGEIILVSEGYKAKTGCHTGIESVRKNAFEDTRYDRRISSNGKPYFVLKAGNGEIIGTSELYESEAARQNGINSVKRNGPTAVVEDLAH